MVLMIGLLSQAQQSIVDSLVQNAAVQITDSLKIDKLHKDFFKYVYSKPKVANQIADYTIANTKVENSPYQHAQSLIRKGIYYDVVSKKDSALLLYDRAMEIAAPRKDYISMGNVYNDKGLVYWNRDELELAMEQYVLGAEVFEKVDYDRGLSSIYNNMGLILYDLGRYTESKTSHLKALKIRERLKDTYGLGASYSNLSNVAKRLDQRDSTQYYMRKAIEIKKESNDKRGLAIAYQNLGIDFRDARVLDSAIFYSEKAQILYEEINNKRLSANNLVTLAEMFQLDGQYEKGIDRIKQGILLIKEDQHKQLAEMEVIKGRLHAYNKDFKESAAAYARALEHRDSYEETERTAQAQEYYEKYQSAQKEQEIAEQRAQLAENDLKLQRRNQTIYLLIGGAILIGLLGFFFMRQRQIKSEQKAKEKELELALAKIETQNKLHEQRLRISRDLHDNIGSQLTFLISSLDNLKYAQNLDANVTNSKLASLSGFTRNTIGELRDTIWAMNKNKISLEDIEERTTSMIAQFNATNNDQIIWNVEFDAANVVIFNSVNGMHVFRIIQEAINNALKYAEANEISIYATSDDQDVHITIKDNGKGFELDNYQPGNGIKNMKERARLINSVLDLSSKKDAGTTIQFSIPSDSYSK
ncbi:putative transmembrane protein [Nonlabens dokdonensis DSW-6]|uniref:histidine kinase n=1 Tax=Nonlabens dokdonensis (strain DSM 17205 / KCTC 12402 / DSW-6) TaxID=592029 RepID=L7W6J0_NONDD|nr:putative transmembrane protein [Nonlabens dokdonensis DSW-6]